MAFLVRKHSVVREALIPTCRRLFEPVPPATSGHFSLRSGLFTTRSTSSAGSSQYSELYSLLSQPNWQEHPSLKTVFPAASSSFSFSGFLSEYPDLNPVTALNFFKFLSASPSFKQPNAEACDSLFNKLLHLADETRMLMLKACKTTEDCKLVLNFVRKGGLSLFNLSGIASYNTLLNSLRELALFDDMESVYGMILEDDNVSPDHSTYVILIRGFCEARRFEEATKLLHQMCIDEKNGRLGPPSVHVYNFLIAVFCTAFRGVDACYLFDEMKRKGCEPDVVTFEYMIGMKYLDGDLEGARSFFDSAVEKGFFPALDVFHALLRGYCFKDMVDDAVLLAQMHHGKTTHDTYRILLRALTCKGRLDDGFKLLGDMEKMGMVPDRWCYVILIGALREQGRVEEARIMSNLSSSFRLFIDGKEAKDLLWFLNYLEKMENSTLH